MRSLTHLETKSWLLLFLCVGLIFNLRADSKIAPPADLGKQSSSKLFSSLILKNGDQKIAFSMANSSRDQRLNLKKQVIEPFYFLANKGQLLEEVDFYLQDKGKFIYFSSEGLSFLLPGEDIAYVIKINFVNARKKVRPLPLGQAETFISYFKGEKENWLTGIPSFKRIFYPDIWPGIDLIYEIGKEGLKSQFIIKPGADPYQIRFQVEGAERIFVNEKQELVIDTPEGAVVDSTPSAYQTQSYEKTEIRVNYMIYDNFIFGFTFGPYDASAELIVDPIILIGGTYFGGPNFDYAYGLAIDNFGFVYLVGYTYSLQGFPLKSGPQLNFNGGDVDAYIIKLAPKDSRIVYCGYIGGSDRDYAYDIAVDDQGAAYVVGYTASRENSFPVVKGPVLIHKGEYDVFVAKINPDGSALEYCGYIGGHENDFGRAIAVDAEGRACVTGYTLSKESSFPVKKGPVLTFRSNFEAFVARLSSDGRQIEFCGYLGGLGDDWGYGIQVDQERAIYIAGTTTSDEHTFPVVKGPDLSFNGRIDAFLAKISSSGEEIIYCGYIGGDGEDVATALDVDSSGFAYITGYTGSTEKTFPVTFGPDLEYNGGFYDTFVAKVARDGNYLFYCGYIGGSDYEAGLGISVDDWGCAYVTGFTSSTQETFPVKDGPELNFSGSFDAFLAKVNFSGAGLIFCGYFGGLEADYGQDVAVEKHGSGQIYLAGSTYSSNLKWPDQAGFGQAFQGRRDAFLAYYSENNITVTSPNGGEIWYSGLEKNITWYTIGEVGPVRIELSTDKGETWQIIAEETENDGLFTWIVPEITSTTCLIRISEADDGVPSDTSDFVFVILNEPVIILTSPNGGEEWPVGSVQKIRWITGSAPVGDIRIEYSTDLGKSWTEIIDRTENDGVFEWEIPDTPSSECLVRISEAEDGSPADISDAPFTIFSPQKPLEGLRKTEKKSPSLLGIKEKLDDKTG